MYTLVYIFITYNYIDNPWRWGGPRFWPTRTDNPWSHGDGEGLGSGPPSGTSSDSSTKYVILFFDPVHR